MGSTFASLPREIQLQVFSYLNEIDCYYTSDRALVCKSWKIPNQELLYKFIEIRVRHQMDEFFKVVRFINKNLGKFVKGLSISYNIDMDEEEEHHFRSDVENRRFDVKLAIGCLPNLEYINLNDNGCFKILESPLRRGKLPRLNYVEPPRNDFREYAVVISELADRLTNLTISDLYYEDDNSFDDYFFSDEEDDEYVDKQKSNQFFTLFDKLETFKKVDTLHLIKSCSDQMKIDLMEKATKRCPLLKNFELTLEPDNNNINHAHSVPAIENIIPALEVSRLTFHESVLHNPQLIDYIIHKYPRLTVLKILDGEYQHQQPTYYMNELQLKKFLDYLSNITYVDIQSILYENQIMVDSIGTFWEMMSPSRTISADFRYNESSTNRTKLSLQMNASIISNVFSYPRTITGSEHHLDLIVKYGHFIHNLTFQKVPFLSEKCLSFESLFVQPLKYCVNLKRLTILGTTLKEADERDFGVGRKNVLDNLRILNCTVENDTVFKKASTLFAHIKLLQLFETKSAIADSAMNIHMGETDVETLSLSTKGLLQTHSRGIKLLVQLTRKNQSLCRLCITFPNGRIQCNKIDERSFNSLREDRESYMFALNFKFLQVLKITHDKKAGSIVTSRLA